MTIVTDVGSNRKTLPARRHQKTMPRQAPPPPGSGRDRLGIQSRF
ncbi:hypothetical protein SynMITS9220_02686 [Synechococcus sp. MIT S9220]|nr:hypothetical protein SynMITS9220_02686 [Synechococcus sp. MIT S9220]